MFESEQYVSEFTTTSVPVSSANITLQNSGKKSVCCGKT